VAFVAFVAFVALTAFVALVAVPVKLAVIVLATKLPPESRATIVDAPLAEAAVVRALSIVPLVIFDAFMAVRATPLPDTEVKVPVVAVTTLAAKLPLLSLATIVDAPFAESAVVRAFAIVPDAMFEALIAVNAIPLPEMDVVVTAFAVKFPEESLATIVDAPLADAAVVRALSIVPLDMLLAFMAVKATPLPLTEVKVPVVPVTTFPAKEPLESRATIVEAPLADDAVVLAFEIVPLDILLALMSVNPAPFPLYAPETVTKVPTFAAKEPLESLATMVDAPLAEAAVVRAFAIVPAEILDALIAVRVNPDPMKFVAVAFPVALRFPVADTFPVAVTLPVAARLAVERFKAATFPV
jgi:predicted dinucleotide-binding enzyme